MSAINSSSVLMAASQQWRTRPDDQRFLTMADLKAHVDKRKSESWTATPKTDSLRIVPDGEEIGVDFHDPTIGARRVVKPTNWGFGQLAQYAEAPAAYLRKLPAELAAINLQWGLEKSPMRDDALVLARSNGDHSLRSMTSTSYGRIWDAQVVKSVERVNTDGRWKVPAASYATTNPRRATTIYGSDRDVFIFLVDDSHPIELAGEKLFRGFYTYNSEVGSATFGICTFLYRYVCDNRMIWGATQVRELKIRHTGGAPERFAYEGAKYLRQYSEESTAGVVTQIQAAQNMEPANATGGQSQADSVQDWLQKRGFSKNVAKGSYEAAVAEEGKARSLWDIVNGITAYARTIPHADARVDLEQRAGKLLDVVA